MMSCERSTEVERGAHRNMGAMDHGTDGARDRWSMRPPVPVAVTSSSIGPERPLTPDGDDPARRSIIGTPEHGTDGTGDHRHRVFSCREFLC
jgi:hypothetical protein